MACKGKKRKGKFIMGLMALTAPLYAGTVYLNGTDSGSLESLTMDSAGTVRITTTGSVVPPPPPPPPLITCPDNVICVKRPWPVIAQEVLTFPSGKVWAGEVQTGLGESTGRWVTNYTSTNTAARIVAISEVPGDVMSVTPSCRKSGLEATTIYWQVGSVSSWKCGLKPQTKYYLNIKFTNCETGKSCSIFSSST